MFSASLKNLHETVARQHALLVRLLPSPLREYSEGYYLFFRILDTVEDSVIDFSLKEELLALFAREPVRALIRVREEAQKGVLFPPEYLPLIRESAEVAALHQSFPPDVRIAVEATASEMATGMLRFARKAEAARKQGESRFLKDLQELDDYCYFAAGCVGDLNTKLFRVAEVISEETFKKIQPFGWQLGNYLQLVNVIRDYARDTAERKLSFFPTALRGRDSTEQLRSVVELARDKEPLIAKYLAGIAETPVAPYVSTLFRVARLHFEFYSENPDIMERSLKPPMLRILRELPFLLSGAFLARKARKVFSS